MSGRNFAGAILTVAAFIGAAPARAEVPWRSSFSVAQAEAKRTHRLLFVEFTVPG